MVERLLDWNQGLPELAVPVGLIRTSPEISFKYKGAGLVISDISSVNPASALKILP